MCALPGLATFGARPIVEMVIESIKSPAEASLHLPMAVGVGHGAGGTTPARLDPLLSASLEEIAQQLAAGDALSPEQRRQIANLLRITLDVFALLSPEVDTGGATDVLRTALARLTVLEPELLQKRRSSPRCNRCCTRLRPALTGRASPRAYTSA